MAKQISAEVKEGDPEVKPAVAVNLITFYCYNWKEESCSPYFEAEDSVVPKNETKEGNTDKQHGVPWCSINRSRIVARSK